MKFTVLILAAGLSSMASAKVTKVCFGSTKSDETKGQVISMQVDSNEVTLVAVKGDTTEGTFKAQKSQVNGRDGKTYLEYDGGYGGEYATDILVDEDLLQKGSTGLIQFRARGEGFFNSVFLCHDPKK